MHCTSTHSLSIGIIFLFILPPSPFSLIVRVLQKVQIDQTEGVIFPPQWANTTLVYESIKQDHRYAKAAAKGKSLLTLQGNPISAPTSSQTTPCGICPPKGARCQTTLPPYSWSNGKNLFKNSAAVIMTGGLDTAKSEKNSMFQPTVIKHSTF